MRLVALVSIMKRIGDGVVYSDHLGTGVLDL
jgi:hypothetical protein